MMRSSAAILGRCSNPAYFRFGSDTAERRAKISVRFAGMQPKADVPLTAIIYKATGNLRAVQILLGHTKIESTVVDAKTRSPWPKALRCSGSPPAPWVLRAGTSEIMRLE